MTSPDDIPTVEQADEYALVIAEEVEAIQARAGEHWNLAEWAVGILAQLDAAEDLIKEQAKAHLAFLLSECKGRRAGLLWKYSDAIRAQVDAELEGKKRRSITYATGRAGYRKQAGRERLVLDDEAGAIAWAEKHCPEAIKRCIDMAVVKRHPSLLWSGPPPGCHVETTEARDNFYIGPVTVTRPELPAPPTGIESKMTSAKDFFGLTQGEEDRMPGISQPEPAPAAEHNTQSAKAFFGTSHLGVSPFERAALDDEDHDGRGFESEPPERTVWDHHPNNPNTLK